MNSISSYNKLARATVQSQRSFLPSHLLFSLLLLHRQPYFQGTVVRSVNGCWRIDSIVNKGNDHRAHYAYAREERHSGKRVRYVNLGQMASCYELMPERLGAHLSLEVRLLRMREVSALRPHRMAIAGRKLCTSSCQEACRFPLRYNS